MSATREYGIEEIIYDEPGADGDDVARELRTSIRLLGPVALGEPVIIEWSATLAPQQVIDIGEWAEAEAGATSQDTKEWRAAIKQRKLLNGDFRREHPWTPGNGWDDYYNRGERDFDPAYEEARTERPPQQPRFPLIPFSKLKPTKERDYLVKGIIPRDGLIPVWGPPKCGKSFWVSDLVLHVALGWNYRDHKVMQGAVVYCAFEGAVGFRKRAEAFRRQHHIPDDQPVPFYLQPLRMNLIKDHQALIQSIRMQLDAPSVIVLDTLNRSLVGSESKDEDMSAYVNAADALREAFNCAVIIVHHCGVDGTRPRGHTSLTGTAEAQISVARDASGDIIVTVEYMKDGEEGEVVASLLEPVEVGADEDGDQLISCIVLPVNAATTRTAPTGPKKGKSSLRDAIVHALGGRVETIIPRIGMDNVEAAKVDDVFEEFKRRYVTKAAEGEKADEAKRKAFNRALKTMPPEFDSGAFEGADWIWRKPTGELTALAKI
jgi:hypothetical protein